MQVEATTGLAPCALLAPCRPPLASSPVGTAILSPMGRARHPHGGTSGLLTDDFSPFSCTLPPPRPLQGPSSSPCVPSSAQRQARAVGSQRTPLRSSCGGSPRRCPSGQTSAREPPERAGRGVWLQQSPTAPAVPSELLVGCWSGAHPSHGGTRPCGWASFRCTQPRAWLVVGEDYRVRIATG